MKRLFPLRIEKLALEGYGLGYHEGKAVFVPCAVPGDEIEAWLLRERKDVAFAQAENFLRRGEGVIPSRCAAFGGEDPCGGCDWLELDYPWQLRYKRELLSELLQPLAPEVEIPETQASPVQIHYRNKAFLPVGGDEKGLHCGIFARWSHHIVQHQSCLLHPPLFDKIAQRCLEILYRTGVSPYDEISHSGTLRHIGFRCSRDLEQVQLILVTRSGKLPFSNLLVKQLTTEFRQLCGIVQNINRERGNVILGREEKLLWGEPWLFDAVGGVNFRIHYRSFWQVNTPLLKRIIGILRGMLSPDDVVYDAFAGIGSLGLCLAGSVKKVLCIEENPAAVADGEFTAEQNKIANASFLCAKTEDALPALLGTANAENAERPQVLILDPPRSGVQSQALQAITSAAIPRIFYLSCSPITLYRDLKILLDSGLYRINLIRPCDMFPQTWHVETLVGLELTAQAKAPAE